MDYYTTTRLLLFGLTALTAGCIWLLWTRTKNIGFVLGMLAIYFWTLQGGWGVSATIHQGSWSQEWTYLLNKMFPVALDRDYMLALIYYGVFIFGVFAAATLTAGIGPPPPAQHPLVIDHRRLSIYCFLGTLVALLLSGDILFTAIRRGTSGYRLIAAGEAMGLRYILFQLILRGTLLAACVGGAAWFTGAKGRLIRGRSRRLDGIRYAISLALLFLICVALGNKNALLLGLVTALTLYGTNAKNPKLAPIAISAFFALSLIAYISLIRNRSPLEALDALSSLDLPSAFHQALSSNEQYAAHLSMYGALSYDIAFTHGSSVLSLLASVVPRGLWPDRPETIYDYYAAEVGLASDQGFTIHHATGWYLNFGLPGLLAGAIVFGSFWGASFKLLQLNHRPPSSLAHTIRLTSFFLISGGLPRLLRGGPEDYKSFVLTTLIIPICFIYTASRIKLPGASNTPMPRVKPKD
jgi:hypothetical protein